jgi:hypothetical protein
LQVSEAWQPQNSFFCLFLDFPEAMSSSLPVLTRSEALSLLCQG